MSDITIVTDSVACLPKSLLDQYSIEIIPFILMSGGKAFRDGVDVNPSQAYEMFQREPDAFRTSPYTPEQCLEVFRRISARSKNILLITVSVKISTSINVARLAQERARSEFPDLRIEVLDSETAAANEGFIVLAAARAVQSGKGFDEVLQAARLMKEKVHAAVLLDTVRYVYRSGRVPKIAAQAASVLNVRPIFNLYGSVHFVTAARTRKAGIERILSIMREKANNKPLHCAVMHAYDLAEAERLRDKVIQDFNVAEIWITEFSPIMGYATGSGTIGLSFYVDD